jgi:LAO/AO transport system kinase
LTSTAAIDFRVHRALARAISAVENRGAGLEEAAAALTAAHPLERTAPAYVIGVTGPPGAGKSTLVDKLIARYRANGETVAVIAVDPSSPFSRGAVLGDRIRMQQHHGDAGVYIRSMASREAGGGLAPATAHAIALAARAGFDVVIVETVGVGQVELEVVSVADVVVVVTVPALGDAVQTIKAGLTEIADIFVVNMADRPGANQTALELRHMVHESGRDVAIVKTIANDGTGVDDLLAALAAARTNGASNAVRSLRFEVMRTVRDRAVRAATVALDEPAAQAIFAKVAARELDRDAAARALLDHVATKGRPDDRP